MMATNGDDNTSELRTGGIKDFIAQTNMIGNVIAAAASQKSFEPLPFSNYSLFDENYDLSQLRIHVNPHAANKLVFLPRTPVLVTVSGERKHGAHIFHPYTYTLRFAHAKHKWEVTRSYKEIKEVHRALAKMVKLDLGRSCSDIPKDEIKPDWPLFPTEHDHLVSAAHIGERCRALADYLQRLLAYPPFRDSQHVLHLLGVSPLSFTLELGASLLESMLHKRSGDNVYYGQLSQLKICCEKAKIFHAKRWFVLKDTYIVYLNEERNNAVGYVMFLDAHFQCKMKVKAGAYHALEVRNLQRSLVLKCRSTQQQKEWHDRIAHMLLGTGRHFHRHELLAHGSYAPRRQRQACKWYVNAALYMEHVMLALNNAREEIFITDWWLCPELFLKRPTDDLQYRLDKILLKKAKEGVKVYILLFKEVSFALNLLSSRAKGVLTQSGKNPNIKVLRHPEHSPAGVFLWSHHEKCVIVDQSVAFMGGIDLCFGRWDDELHRLVDLGRKENVTDIDLSQVEKTQTSRLNGILNEMEQISHDADNTLEPLSAAIADTVAVVSNLEVGGAGAALSRLSAVSIADSATSAAGEQHMNDQERELASVKKEELQALEEQKAADALIVAALMGNSITRFSRTLSNNPLGINSQHQQQHNTNSSNSNNNAKESHNTQHQPHNQHRQLRSQMSAPVSSPVFVDSLYNSQTTEKTTRSFVDDATTSLGGGGGTTNNDIELRPFGNSKQHQSGDTVSVTAAAAVAFRNTNSSNKSNNINNEGFLTVATAATSSSGSKSAANQQIKANCTSSNLTNTRILGSTSKASKFMELLHHKAHKQSSPTTFGETVAAAYARTHKSRKAKDLSVPTETDDGGGGSQDDDNSSSKKQRVRRKWDKFKKTVKRRSHLTNKLKRRSSDTSSNGDEYESDSDYELPVEDERIQPPVISNEGYYWLGKDYSNSYKADFKDLQDFSTDQFNRNEVPRMPWRDEALVVFGESARDLARHFIQRWNQCKREKVRQIEAYPFLLPKCYTEEPLDIKQYTDWFQDQQLYSCDVQMTRSLDSWSGGISQTETSILNAYCELIRKAEHFIYIENQFFVTTTEPNKDFEVKNTIGLELVNRIIRAHQEKTKFRVYVVLPLLPGFENMNAIQAVQFFNLRSINLGEYSIYKALKKSGIADPSEYITFYGMRNWSVLMGKLVQEIIYVHSKLMIVDDRHVICGSANINDRSLLGKRDSEIAAVISDCDFVDSTLAGQKVKVGAYAFSLRKKIFKLHLGIYFTNKNGISVNDCVSDEFYRMFRTISHQNTMVFDEVFKCLPSDNIVNFDDLTSYRHRPCLSKNDPLKGKESLENNVSGFIVDFPLKFLSQEKKFFPDINTKEGMVPTAMWT